MTFLCLLPTVTSEEAEPLFYPHTHKRITNLIFSAQFVGFPLLIIMILRVRFCLVWIYCGTQKTHRSYVGKECEVSRACDLFAPSFSFHTTFLQSLGSHESVEWVWKFQQHAPEFVTADLDRQGLSGVG